MIVALIFLALTLIGLIPLKRLESAYSKFICAMVFFYLFAIIQSLALFGMPSYLFFAVGNWTLGTFFLYFYLGLKKETSK